MSKIEILGDRQLNESFGNYCFNLVGWKIRQNEQNSNSDDTRECRY